MTRTPPALSVALAAAAVVLVGAPLLYSTAVYHPFSTPKIVAVGLAAGLTVLSITLLPGSGVHLPRTPLVVVSIALALAGLSYAFSPLPGISLWGRPNQEVGLLVVVYSLILYVLGMLLTRPVESILDPVRVATWASLPVLFMTGWALAGLPLSDNMTSSTGGRPSATFGNPVHLAAYLAAGAVLAAGTSLYGEHLRARIPAVLLAAACAVGVVLAASRAALAGLLVGLVLLAMTGGHRLPRKWLVPLPVLLILGLLAGAAINPGESILYKVRNITDPRFYGARWHAWAIALDALPQRPLFGVGPANFERIFYRALTPELIHDYFAFERFTDAHSWPLELATTYGLPFALVFAWLLLRPLIRLRALDPSRRVAYAGALALAVSYLFNPLAISTLPLLALYAGLAGGSPTESRGTPGSRPALRSLSLAAGTVLALAMLLPALFFLRADFELRQGSLHNDLDRMRSAADGLKPGLPSFYYPPGRKLSYEVSRDPSPQKAALLNTFYALPRSLDPEEPDTELQWAVGLLGAKQYEQAIAHIERALQIAPGSPHPLGLLAVTYLEMGQPRKALPILETLQRDYPGEEGVRKLLDQARKEAGAD